MKKLFSIFLILFAFLVSAQADAPDIDGLVYENETSLQYAQGFHLYRYQGGFPLRTEQIFWSFQREPMCRKIWAASSPCSSP